MKKLAVAFIFLLITQMGYALSVSSMQTEEEVIFLMESDPDLEFVNSRVLQQGDTIRFIGELKFYNYANPFIKSRIRFDKKLQYSRFEQKYIVLENDKKVFSDEDFKTAYSQFCKISYDKKRFENRKIVARFAYTSYDYQWPFSLLYFFPGPQAFERQTLKLKF